MHGAAARVGESAVSFQLALDIDLQDRINTSESLRIALVSTQAKWHGGEKQAALLAQGLRDRGHACSILARAGGEFARRMADDGFDVRTFPGSGRSPKAVMAIREALRSVAPDVVHANDSHALTGGALGAMGLSIPLRVAARRVDFPVRSRLRYRYLSHGLLCVSSAVAEVCASAGLPASMLYVVHDGVDPAFAASGARVVGRQSLQLAAEQPLLLTVAKLTDHKGHRYLLDAMPAILKAHPNVVLALAGDGELREELERQVTELGIGESVRFLGFRNDVANLLAAADIVVQPSHLEGLCSSLIDAMLASRPIVASAAGGIPDLLSTATGEPQVAWLTPTKSSQHLSDAICDSLADRPAALVRGQRANERAMQLFTAERMVGATIAAYADIATRVYGTQAAERLPALFPSSANTRRAA